MKRDRIILNKFIINFIKKLNKHYKKKFLFTWNVKKIRKYLS
jgi:hypothetical protein